MKEDWASEPGDSKLNLSQTPPFNSFSLKCEVSMDQFLEKYVYARNARKT